MSVDAIITIIILAFALVGAAIALITALVRGDMKTFIQEKMIEAEKSGKSGDEKLKFVVEAFKEKYKIMEFVLDAKKFIEEIIKLTKQINSK